MRIAVLALALIALQVQAQTWPSKPVRLIAPYPPGGQTDVVSRWLGEKLTPVLGQPVVVENRAGAQGGGGLQAAARGRRVVVETRAGARGAVGLQAAKSAAPDGYTFVYTNVSNLSIAPNLET